ncbi:MAG: tyrosine-type recombinase/integrase [Desulfobacterales bacterium]|nr:tyrosine-type recombinase/integrase [Deltaproteobacteria bacterium]NNK94494.1 tyrosine-type recombinase/integrase [Desulfobacterales bacterium]
MNLAESILNYRKYLKRRNYTVQSVNSYLYRLKHFLIWLRVPIEEATPAYVKGYLDTLLEQKMTAKTINERLVAIRSFYRYLAEEENRDIKNPAVRGMALRMPKPLPRHVRQGDLDLFFTVITKKRDRAMFMLMLRCGLRVEEVANLSINDIDYQCSQIMVRGGKGDKDRTTYFSSDAGSALAAYLRIRPSTREQRVFLVEKGVYRGKPLSVRGIQKRMEYYAKKSGISISCHQLRHTMATQLLNGGADIVAIQELLGHSTIELTMRYSRLSNMKAQHDYYQVMDRIMEKGDQAPPAQRPLKN